MYFAIHPIYTTCYAETLYLLVIEIFKDKILIDYENGKILINGKEDTITYSLNQNIQTIHSQMESRCVRIAKALAFNYADKIKKQYGEIMAYNNLTHIAEIASEVTAGNVAHKVATVKSLCKRNIDFINEFGLEK